MRTSRLLAVSMIFGLGLFACGGDDGGGGGGVDAPSNIDAAVDAPPTPKQIGSACVPSMTDPAGDCGAGFVCLELQGGTGPWCSKTCTPGAGDTCGASFTGANGRAACVFQVTAGMQTITVCGVVCSTVDPQQCTTCNGTCPAPLMCNAPLMNSQMQTVAQACQ